MSKRTLSPSELFEARLVFGDGLQYDRVHVSEGGYFPNFIADLGALLQGRKRTWDNAVTLGDTSHFPRRLRTEPHELAQDLTDMAWLIHELTHQWQYQTVGWRYLWEALQVQIAQGPAGYDYAGKHGTQRGALRAARSAEKRFADFNREQQGDIARDYFLARKRSEDVADWEPFLDDVRKQGRPRDASRE